VHRIEFSQETGIGIAVVADKARHRPLPAPHLALVHILRHQTGNRLPGIATDALEVAQDHAPVASPQGPVPEAPQSLLDPVVARVLALDGKRHRHRPRQERAYILQAL
jgi:hypothetical protein